MENTTQVTTGESSQTAVRDSGIPTVADFDAASLKVKDIMSRNVVSSAPPESLLSAAARMSEHGVPCVVVVDGDEVVGIMTERDVLREATHGIEHVRRLAVADTMSSPVVAVNSESPILDAGALMATKGIKRLVVLENDRLCAVLTQTDVNRGLISMGPIKDVSTLMSTDVASVEASAPVAKAIDVMGSRHVSAVVAVGQNEPVGILTEKDVLRQIVARCRDPRATMVREIMSRPVVSVPLSHSIISTCQMMDDKRIHRVIVTDHGQVHGIISQTDLLDALLGYFDKTRADGARGRAASVEMADTIASNLSTIDGMIRRIRTLSEQVAADASTGDTDSPACADCRILAGIQALKSVEELIGQCKDDIWQIARRS